MALKSTQTEKNILTAFCGESQARNRYTYFSAQARKEGYVQISNIFEETANHEREHAKRLFKLLEGGEVEVTASFPAGVVGSTLENLKEAAGGENYEYSTMYPEFAATAREEGFPGDCRGLHVDRRCRKISRRTLPEAPQQHQKQPGLQARAAQHLALPELWLPT